MKKITDYIMVAVKGACMGAADVIPGVSGGTIAFITGIYDQLIGSINSINGTALKLFFSGKFKEFWKHINGSFLVSLFCGILVSVLSLAGLMQYLLEHHPIQTWAFFFGLIVASSIFILRGIQGWNMKSAMFPVLGVVLGIVVCTLSPTQTPDALWFIFLSGAIAICAMILPGISGSFILLILGKYKYIMGAITGLTTGAAVGESLVILCVFAVGAVCGILAFSRLLHWLLARFNKETLMVLAGFIIGSLVKVWPWSNMEAIVISQFPEIADMAAATQQAIPAEVLADYIPQVDMQIGSAVLFALIGFFLVTGIEILGKAMKLRQTA
jgi:putative membrane protein